MERQNGASGATVAPGASHPPGIPPAVPVSQAPPPPGAPYVPLIRSGFCSSQGSRGRMEDVHIICDDIKDRLTNAVVAQGGPFSFFGVFDGHGGKSAAEFAQEHMLKLLLGDPNFPADIPLALKQTFTKVDEAYQEALEEGHVSSSAGTTAIVALIMGRTLYIANAGDSRAVLGQRGRRALVLSRDHKCTDKDERARIEANGGYVDSHGYLNGQLSVARALGDWHLMTAKRSAQLTAEPEVRESTLGPEDEFLLLACDGLWDVVSNDLAVDNARKRLQQHNDPTRCAEELVDAAISGHSSDNITVVVVCFQPDHPARVHRGATPPSGPGSGGGSPAPGIRASGRPTVRRSISVDGLRGLQEALDRR